MCNRYARGERDVVLNLFDIKKISIFNEGPRIIHPREPGPVVRLQEGEMILEQMTWGFPVVLKGKLGQHLKPWPTNNARFDKLNRFWKRWADFPAQRCLIPTASYAEAVGETGKNTARSLLSRHRHLEICLGRLFLVLVRFTRHIDQRLVDCSCKGKRRLVFVRQHHRRSAIAANANA